MRGIGSLNPAVIGMMALSGAMDTVFNGYGIPTKKQPSYGTGWQDRKFEHPKGETSFRPVGNKRQRRRNAAKSK